MTDEWRRWKISIPVQVYDDEGCFVPAPGEHAGNEFNIGQRIEVTVRAKNAKDACAIAGEWISNRIDE